MRKLFPAVSLATLALVTGCPDETPSDDEVGDTATDSTGDGDTTTDSSTDTTEDTTETTDGIVCGDGRVDDGEECDDTNDVDTDECTNACTIAACGDGVVQAGVEACDDGNLDNDDGCSALCVVESCGDGIMQAMEECDDGNVLDTDACTSLCLPAACGDGFVQEGVEDCDDGDAFDTDECLTTCVMASCGDGFVFEGVEECDDANDVDTDECLGTCSLAACGDGVLQVGVEECDDGNLDPNDACDDLCMLSIEPNLLRCGTSLRNVADFIPMGVNLTVVASCTPDADTQAMLITRTGVGMFNPATVKAWVEGGGIVLTETGASDEVYNAVFGTAVAPGNNIGNCTDIAPTVVQFSAMDQFWQFNPFQMITLAQTGCGQNVANYPMITPLAGWTAQLVSIGYRDAGLGRVWVTEFDWRDTDTQGAAYDYTESLMGYMIVNG
jgi:cysteine-rich repeat protein